MPQKFFVSRYKPRPRAHVFTERVVDDIWKKASEGPLLDGQILDMLYGNSPDRPANAYEAIRQLDKIYIPKYGRGLLSTTAHRAEDYEGEKTKRRN